MFGAFHWFDLLVPLMLLALLVGGLVVAGWSIGAGYAWMRHRLERRAE